MRQRTLKFRFGVLSDRAGFFENNYPSARDWLSRYLSKNNLKTKIVYDKAFERIVLVEETTFIYIGLTEMESPALENPFCEKTAALTTFSEYCSIVELNYNPFFKLSPAQLEEETGGPGATYDCFFASKYHRERFNACCRHCSNLGLEYDFDAVREAWEGVPAALLIFKLQIDSLEGYAVSITDNPSDVHAVAKRLRNQQITPSKIFPNPYFAPSSVISFSESFTDLYRRYPGKANETITYGIKNIFIKDKTPAAVEALRNEYLAKARKGFFSDLDYYEFQDGHQKWKSEQLVLAICEKLYKGKVIYQHRPLFLKSNKGQLSYDVFIAGIDCAIEYQGKQHFEPVAIFGGKEGYLRTVERDEIKRRLSKENGIALAYINYTDTITTALIKEKINQAIAERSEHL